MFILLKTSEQITYSSYKFHFCIAKRLLFFCFLFKEGLISQGPVENSCHTPRGNSQITKWQAGLWEPMRDGETFTSQLQRELLTTLRPPWAKAANSVLSGVGTKAVGERLSGRPRSPGEESNH